MSRLKKGSAEAKRYMAKIRGMRKGAKKSKVYKSKSVTVKQKNKRKGYSMARKHKGRSRRKFTLPIAPIAGLAAGLAKPAEFALKGDLRTALVRLGNNYTGYSADNNDFRMYRLKEGLVPLVIGALVHKFVGGYLGVNRVLGQARVPLIRI